MRSQPVTAEVANQIYDVLCEHAGCYRSPDGEIDMSRMAFIRYATEGTWTEFRFGGVLGFGGKVWNNSGQWYVSCYQENEGAKERKVIKKINAALDKLFEETYGSLPRK